MQKGKSKKAGRRALTLRRNQNSKGKEIQKQQREAHREAGRNKREEKKSERLYDSSAAEQQVTEKV